MSMPVFKQRGLKQGSSVLIAGVEVGRIRSVDLDDYQARIVMNLNDDVKIQRMPSRIRQRAHRESSLKSRGRIG